MLRSACGYFSIVSVRVSSVVARRWVVVVECGEGGEVEEWEGEEE